jgi:hypothetical protein
MPFETFGGSELGAGLFESRAEAQRANASRIIAGWRQ